jgi:hypothetical protein
MEHSVQEKSTVPRLFKRFFVFYVTQMLMTVLKISRPLDPEKPDEFNPDSISLRSVLRVLFNLHPDIPRGLFPLDFTPEGSAKYEKPSTQQIQRGKKNSKQQRQMVGPITKQDRTESRCCHLTNSRYTCRNTFQFEMSRHWVKPRVV